MSVRAKPSEPDRIALAFDGEAGRYAEAFEAPASAANMRATTHQLYQRYLRAGDRILDLNCGPGPDFDFFREIGVQISGLDLSEEMLNVAQARAPEAELHCLDYNDIDQLDDRFNAICSNFGGLNTQNEFAAFAGKCSDRLHPEGYLFCNVMTPFPLPEILEGIFHGGHWLRRLRHRDSKKVRVGGCELEVFYFWPGAFYRKFFRKEFRLLSIVGLGVFLPPPYLTPAKMKLPRWALFLERHFAHRFPTKYWGDHAMLVMQKR